MYRKEEIEQRGYRILIIDDDELICKLTTAILNKYGFLADKALSGMEGIALAKKNHPNLILLDKVMPGMDGFATLKKLEEDKETKGIPVVILTGQEGDEHEIECFEAGAEDFIRKPFVPEIMIQRVMRIIEHSNLQHDLEELVDQRTNQLRMEEESYRRLSDQIIFALSTAVDAKDEYTNGHSRRVAKYSTMIAQKLGKSQEYQRQLYYMGLLHDIGKIGIPDEIIQKNSKLTDEEYNTIRMHPVIGAKILDTIEEMPQLAIGARYHHERFDGKGYPDGLKGFGIPEQARILAVADSYDAMTSKRTYQDITPQSFARSEIEKGKGTQFDPDIADAMLAIIDEDTEFRMKGE